MPSFLSGLADAAGKGLAGYADGQREVAAERRRLAERAIVERLMALRQKQTDETHAATMRGHGYVPTTGAGADPQLSVGNALGAATAGVGGPGLAAADVGLSGVRTPKRYGATAGDYTFDTASPAAQLERARVADVTAQAAERAAKASAGPTDRWSVQNTAESGLVAVNPRTLEAKPVLVDGKGLHRPSVMSRVANGETTAHRDARQNATAVRGQLNATEHDLAAARRDVPKQPAFFASPDDSTSFVHRRDAAGGVVKGLTARRDSLTSVLDRETGSMQGRPPAPPSPTAPHPSGLSTDEVRGELQRNRERYQRLLDSGADPTEAKNAWLETNRLTIGKLRKGPK